MARVTRIHDPGERNKGLCSTFLPPEEGRRVQRPKRCNKHGDKDEDNSPKNVKNVFTFDLFIYIADVDGCGSSGFYVVIFLFIEQ